MEGTNLNKLLTEFRLSDTAHANICQHEQQVMEISAQLMQVCKLQCIIEQVQSSMPDLANMFCADMYYLHGIDLARLDITSSNIMLRKEGYSAWDQLRLLDFGFAHHCNKGEALCMHSRLTLCCRSVLLKAVPPSCASNKWL